MSKKDKELDDSKKFYKEELEPILKSKGTQKMWNYFLEVSKKDFFTKTIRKLRKKYKIPFNG
ncbi:hypothetical protein KJ636_04415 [Patescibacteria group bacterium]|nr:hypothetical protein [Patescibacteria group bacterium]